VRYFSTFLYGNGSHSNRVTVTPDRFTTMARCRSFGAARGPWVCGTGRRTQGGACASLMSCPTSSKRGAYLSQLSCECMLFAAEMEMASKRVLAIPGPWELEAGNELTPQPWITRAVQPCKRHILTPILGPRGALLSNVYRHRPPNPPSPPCNTVKKKLASRRA
jgi:hypothetical protein